MKAITTIERISDVLIKHIKECDGDELLAIFEYTFGTSCHFDKKMSKVVITPGKDDEYGGIIEEEFKEDIAR